MRVSCCLGSQCLVITACAGSFKLTGNISKHVVLFAQACGIMQIRNGNRCSAGMTDSCFQVLYHFLDCIDSSALVHA